MNGYELALACLALNIYHEAAPTDSAEARYAIAFVTINRTKKSSKDICGVVFAPKQFSWANHALDKRGKLLPTYLPYRNAHWTLSRNIAKIVISGLAPDFTGGATHYHADYIATPKWAAAMKPAGKYGAHYFYR